MTKHDVLVLRLFAKQETITTAQVAETLGIRLGIWHPAVG
jgi:hypothetical protein